MKPEEKIRLLEDRLQKLENSDKEKLIESFSTVFPITGI